MPWKHPPSEADRLLNSSWQRRQDQRQWSTRFLASSNEGRERVQTALFVWFSPWIQLLLHFLVVAEGWLLIAASCAWYMRRYS